jgi:hypothetical protein
MDSSHFITPDISATGAVTMRTRWAPAHIRRAYGALRNGSIEIEPKMVLSTVLNNPPFG